MTNLLNLFYELEFNDDDIPGLSQYEYQTFLARLDEDIASKFKFKTYEQMDVNGDGTIDLEEFQAELDRIYNRMDESTKLKENRVSNKKKKNQGKDDWSQWLT